MPTNTAVPDALIVSGDARIETLLSRKDTVVTPAYACRLDGFVNDTFTEYANASVYRPASVCRARLASTLSDTVRSSGGYCLGFTMYTAAGHDEPVAVYIGHRQVACAHIADPDNRVHLFVVPEKFPFRGGEPIRLVTAETNGPCRIENLVLLPKKPTPSAPRLDVRSPHVDLRHADGGLRAFITWMTNRPASGRLRWNSGKARPKTVRFSEYGVNHEAVLDGLHPGETYRYEIDVTDRTGKLKGAHAGSFVADLAPPQSRTRKARIPLLPRRPAPGASPWPVSAGVPFPKGALGSAEQIRLIGPGRNDIPVQAASLARWPDGSVRWALLDFQAVGQANLTAEYGRDITPSRPHDALDIAESRSGITVTTGPIRVEFPRDKVCLPGIVSLRQDDGTYRRLTPANPDPAVTLIAGDGGRYTSGKPDAVALEASGPERACVRIDLSHKGKGGKALFRSAFRIHLFRNSSAVRVTHTFENDCVDDEFSYIRELSLRASLDVGAAPAGRIGHRKVEGLKAQPAVLTQSHDNRYTVTQGRRTLAKGKRADGSLDLTGGNAGVSLAVRDFWQNYPKGISLDGSGIDLHICPPLKKDAYPRGGEIEDRLYYYLLDGRYKLKYGVSRTHEFWLHFRSAGSKPPADFAETVQAPPLYSVSLAAFNKSRAFTQLPAKDPSPFPPYEKWVDAAQQAYAEDRQASRAYGMLNYGDWFGERTYNWGNMEYDAPWCFLQEYLRGGHPDFYTWAEEAVRHLVDVDTCHHSPNPGEVDTQYLHCVGHTGNYYPDGYRESAIFSGRSSVSHTWVEGSFLYGLLSGDARALEGAMATSNRLVGRMLNHYDFTNCRNSGWHLIHLSAAYRATGRRVYLNAARIIVDRVLERQRPSGGWDRLMVPGHCYCEPPRHTGNAGFMVGILMVGLKRYYEATGEKRIAGAIVRAADYCIDAMWVPENAAFHYTSCPVSSLGNSADMRILKGVAAAYRFSGKERFKQILSAGVQSAMAGRLPRAHRGIGKGICSPMRGAPQVLVDLPEDMG